MTSEDLGALVHTVSVETNRVRRLRAASRIISILEAWPERAGELLVHGSVTQAPVPQIIGITGAPGSGKSSLTARLIERYRGRFPDRFIGILAVDPTSPFTGGAILGDRIRMMKHATDPRVFIRSLATRGHLGGLTLGIESALRVLGLLGCQTVILETVGVGQSEIEIAAVADTTLVVLAPGHGDTVQLLKAGLMEIADVFVVNKSDLPGADALLAALTHTLRMAPSTAPDDPEAAPNTGMPRSFLVSAKLNSGLEALVDMLEEQRAAHHETWKTQRSAALNQSFREAVLQRIRSRAERILALNPDLLADWQARQAPLDSVTDALIDLLTNQADS